MTISNPVISCEFVEDHSEDEQGRPINRSGYALRIDGREMVRVAFVRRYGANPDETFQERLDAEIAKARHALAQHAELAASYNALFPIGAITPQ